MRRSIRLLVCVSMLGTAACVSDAVTGPTPAAPEPETQVQAASDAAEPAEAAPAPKAGPRSILLRGMKSMNVDRTREPLYIIDGVIIMTGSDVLNGLDASDIESIEVLKGVQLAQVYGRRLENGVVIITTRSGRLRSTRR